FAGGLFLLTFVFNLFFVNLPVEGEPIELTAYFQGSIKTHLIGLVAGVVLSTGILAVLVAQGGAPEQLPAPTTIYALMQGAVLIGGIWGVFKLNDFRDAEPRVRPMLWLFLALYVGGIAALAFAA